MFYHDPTSRKAHPDFDAVKECFLHPVEELHPPDSIVGFLRRNAQKTGGVENLFALPQHELKHRAAELAPWLDVDAYFTVNGFKCQAPFQVRETQLPGVWRREQNLRYLNAVYADLDIGRMGAIGPRGLSLNEASQLLFDLLAHGQLPHYSMIAASGRGLYVYWFLREEEENWPEGEEDEISSWRMRPIENLNWDVFRPKLRLYKRINQAIYRQLECLAADHIFDAARILRVPGTLHSTSGEPCFYYYGYDNARRKREVTYTLKQLAQVFGVPVREEPVTSVPWRSTPSLCPQKANAPKACAAARARELKALEERRGGWTKPQGCLGRRYHLRLYAQLLKTAGLSKGVVLAEVERMASRCQPLYPSDKNDQGLRAIVDEVWSQPFRLFSRSNLVKSLQVTEEEVRELALDKLTPFQPEEQKGPSRREQAKRERHALILQIIQERGLLSEREFVAVLQARGIQASAPTVHRDLVALGYSNHSERKKAGRKSRGQQPLLPQNMALL